MVDLNENQQQPDTVPTPTLLRLGRYLVALQRLSEEDTGVVDAHSLAEMTGANAAQVRKDLSHLSSLHFGSFGTPGVGYAVKNLLYVLSHYIGLTKEWSVAIVGYGSVGSALAHYPGFAQRNFRISAIFDSDPAKIGLNVGEATVWSLEDLERVIRERGISIAVIAVPADAAQSVTNLLIRAGIKALLNFAPVHLKIPGGVEVRQVDLANELQMLAFFATRRSSQRRQAKSRSTSRSASQSVFPMISRSELSSRSRSQHSESYLGEEPS